MYEEVTFESVMDDLLGRIDDIYDKRESSPIYAALAPAALEIANIYAALDDMMDEIYADTASREYLVRLAAARGLSPYEATYAAVKAEFYPDTVEIELGAEFTGGSEDGDGLVYKTGEKIADGIYRLECTESGEAGNLYTGSIVPSDDIEGLERAEITEILAYGEDEEDTEHFRSRYLESFEADAFGGNRADYRNKAMKIPGVTAVKVLPVWNGAGTVKVVIAGAGYKKASDELVTEVQNIFDPEQNGMGNGLAPVGHAVTVTTVEETEVNIKTGVTYDTGYDWNTCRAEAEAAVVEYLSSMRREWSSQGSLVVRISGINAAIMSVHGILDVAGTKLNGAGNNLELGGMKSRYLEVSAVEDEKLDLMDYLPDYLKTYKELQQIMNTESIELQKLEDRHQRMIEDGFIISCGSYGVGRFEKLLGIVPLADDTLDTRRFRVQSKWNNGSPYNYAYLEEQLSILCGREGYVILFDRERRTLTVKVKLVSKNMMDSVDEFLRNVVPCNLVLETGLLYNQHGKLGKFTHKQLAAYTHKQLREDVIE